MTYTFKREREELLGIVHNMWNRQLTNAAGGNLALQVEEDRILVSPSMMSEHHRCNISPDDFLLIDFAGNVLETNGGIVSRETAMHISLLKNFDYITASIHAHPKYCMVFASQHKAVPSMTEATMKKGEASGVIPYTKAYTPELAANIYAYFNNNREKAEKMPLGLILPLHGVLCTGDTLSGAYSMLERMETDAVCALFSKLI